MCADRKAKGSRLKKGRIGKLANMVIGSYERQAREYANGRPQYPSQLFSFIAKHTPHRRLAWDVGTGSGQAALALSEIFDRVIATDVSEQQISYAPRRPNIAYAVTPREMSLEELESTVGAEGSVDLVTVAQALHFFELQSFYGQVKHVLRKPGGVFAAWCYSREAVVNPSVDRVFQELYRASDPFWTPARQLVDGEYATIDFPFRSVTLEGEEGGSTTAPIKFWAKRELGFEGYLSLIRSWSAYQIAKSKGVELLDEQIVARLKEAWRGSDHEDVKTVSWPVFFRIGLV